MGSSDEQKFQSLMKVISHCFMSHVFFFFPLVGLVLKNLSLLHGQKV